MDIVRAGGALRPCIAGQYPERHLLLRSRFIRYALSRRCFLYLDFGI